MCSLHFHRDSTSSIASSICMSLFHSSLSYSHHAPHRSHTSSARTPTILHLTVFSCCEYQVFSSKRAPLSPPMTPPPHDHGTPSNLPRRLSHCTAHYITRISCSWASTSSCTHSTALRKYVDVGRCLIHFSHRFFTLNFSWFKICGVSALANPVSTSRPENCVALQLRAQDGVVSTCPATMRASRSPPPRTC
jgi:hypothetical protein